MFIISTIICIFIKKYQIVINLKIGIIDIYIQIEDPRMNRKRGHKMETIIYIYVAATICGAQSWNEIDAFGNPNFDFFKSRVPDLETIPSHNTFSRFISIIKSDYFELIFRNWVKQVCEEIKGISGLTMKSLCKDRFEGLKSIFHGYQAALEH